MFERDNFFADKKQISILIPIILITITTTITILIATAYARTGFLSLRDGGVEAADPRLAIRLAVRIKQQNNWLSALVQVRTLERKRKCVLNDLKTVEVVRNLGVDRAALRKRKEKKKRTERKKARAERSWRNNDHRHHYNTRDDNNIIVIILMIIRCCKKNSKKIIQTHVYKHQHDDHRHPINSGDKNNRN